jgi:nicotinamidase/pyrazinamidase
VEDALNHGYKTYYLRDASKAVNVNPDDGKNAEDKMQRAGVLTVETGLLLE